MSQAKIAKPAGRPGKQGRATVPTRKQFNTALQRCEGYPHARRNQAMLVLFFALGLRPKEIVSLTLGDVYNFNADALHPELVLRSDYTKRAKIRSLALNNDLLIEHLLRYIRDERRDRNNRFNSAAALILSQRGGPFTANSIGNLMNKILEKRCNIGRASAYSGRRYFITTMARNNVDVRSIQYMAGHGSLATTQIYIETDPLIMGDATKEVL